MHFNIDKDVAERYIRYVGLDDIKKSGKHYHSKCPYCKKKGIKTLVRKFYILMTKGVNVYCHRCGTRKSFSSFLEEFSPSTLESIKSEMLFQTKDTQQKPELLLKKETVPKATPEILTQLITVNRSDKGHKYCTDRMFPEFSFSEFYYCENYQLFLYENKLLTTKPFKKIDRRIVIPFYNERLELTHIQGRALDKTDKMRYITITLIEDSPKIWGLNRINKNKTIYICEGVFDAIFVENSIAIGSAFADLTVLKDKGINLNNVVFCFDHDLKTNGQLQEAAKKYLDVGAKLFFWEDNKYNDIKDFNEFVQKGNSIEALNKMIKDNSFEGFMAKVKLTMI